MGKTCQSGDAHKLVRWIHTHVHIKEEAGDHEGSHHKGRLTSEDCQTMTVVISSCFLKSFSEFTASVSSNRVMMPGMSFILLFIRAIPDTGEKIFSFYYYFFSFLSFVFCYFSSHTERVSKIN